MAASERDVYKEISTAAKREGGRSVKIADRHTGGIPDMHVTLPQFGGTWTEIKFIKTPPKTRGYPFRLELTELQRNFIAAERAAGGQAGWILCVKMELRLWHYYAGNDSTVERVQQLEDCVVRKAGEELDLIRLISLIHK